MRERERDIYIYIIGQDFSRNLRSVFFLMQRYDCMRWLKEVIVVGVGDHWIDQSFTSSQGTSPPAWLWRHRNAWPTPPDESWPKLRWLPKHFTNTDNHPIVLPHDYTTSIHSILSACMIPHNWFTYCFLKNCPFRTRWFTVLKNRDSKPQSVTNYQRVIHQYHIDSMHNDIPHNDIMPHNTWSYHNHTPWVSSSIMVG